jgi:Glyoxalase-like domain
MRRLKQIVIDCHHPAGLAKFWAAALDDFDVRAYDDAEIARLAALGFTPETDPVVLLDGPHIEICFQKVDLPPLTKEAPWSGVAVGAAGKGPLRLVGRAAWTGR